MLDFLLSVLSVLAIALAGGFLLFLAAQIIQLLVVLVIVGATMLRRALRLGVGILSTAFVLGYFLATPAIAADTLLHIPQPLWDEINAVLIGLFLALGATAWKWIDAHSPLKKSQAAELARTAFQDLLDKGAQYGLTQLQGAETSVGSIDVGNAAVAAGANFVLSHGPDLAKRMGVDITTDEGRGAIIRSVTLRVGAMTGTGDGAVIRKSGESTLTIPQKAAPAVIPLPASVSLVGSPTGSAGK